MSPETIHSTAQTVKGPWLLARDALVELDAIFDDLLRRELSVLEHRRSELLESERRRLQVVVTGSDAETRIKTHAESVVEERLQRPQRTVVVGLATRQIVGATLEEVEASPDLIVEAPKNIRFDLTVDPRWRSSTAASVSIDDDNLAIKVEREPGIADPHAAFAALNRWAVKHRPSWALSAWLSYGPPLGWATLFPVILLLLAWLAIPNSGSAQLKERGRQIVRQGLNESNRDEAVAILLALATDYADELPHQPRDWRLFGFLVVALVVVGVALTAPRNIVGLGAGERNLRRSRFYVRLVLFFVPGSLILPFALNKLAAWL